MTDPTIPKKLKPKTLAENLERMAQLKKPRDQVRETKAEYEQLKDEIYYQMTKTGTAKTKPVDGVYALISYKTTGVVTDQEALEKWLQDNEYPESDYTERKLRLDRIDAIAKEAHDINGELIDGFEYIDQEVLSIRSEAKK